MKKIFILIVISMISIVLHAQEDGQYVLPVPKFKMGYAGTSVEAGAMFAPKLGTAFYVAPKIRFAVTPRFYMNTGVSMVTYNTLPSSNMFESSTFNRQSTAAYTFVEGTYLLSERWLLNGSAMKKIDSPKNAPNVAPFRSPSEAMHFGVEYKVTPNITVGARVGYTNF
jgi:hypothetical protein